jgi:hypothetical protein
MIVDKAVFDSRIESEDCEVIETQGPKVDVTIYKVGGIRIAHRLRVRDTDEFIYNVDSQ